MLCGKSLAREQKYSVCVRLYRTNIDWWWDSSIYVFLNPESQRGSTFKCLSWCTSRSVKRRPPKRLASSAEAERCRVIWTRSHASTAESFSAANGSDHPLQTHYLCPPTASKWGEPFFMFRGERTQRPSRGLCLDVDVVLYTLVDHFIGSDPLFTFRTALNLGGQRSAKKLETKQIGLHQKMGIEH